MHPPTSLSVDSIFLVSLMETRLVPTVGKVGGASGKEENPAPEEAKDVGEEGETADAPPETAPAPPEVPTTTPTCTLVPTRDVREDLEKAPVL